MKLTANLLFPSRQCSAWLFALLASYGCSASPGASTKSGRLAPQVQSEPNSEPNSEPETFRAFVAPEPLQISAPSDISILPTKNSCVQVDSATFDHERARGVAALDIHLRKNGGLVLNTQLHDDNPRGFKPIGSVFRGEQGERLMVLGFHSQCRAPVPYGLSSKGDVFPAYITLDSARSQKIKACVGDCETCGRMPERLVIVAEVPEGSRVVAATTLTIPTDLAVVFEAQTSCPKDP